MPEKPLIVVSAVKQYAKSKTGVRCSEKCANALHKIARQAIDHALTRAALEKRGTLLERDFDYLSVADETPEGIRK